MNEHLLFLLVLCVFCRGWVPGIAFLWIALHCFSTGAAVPVEAAHYLLLTACVLAMPAAAYLAGVLLDAFAVENVKGEVFRQAACALAFLLIFQSEMLIGYFEAALLVVQQQSLTKQVFFLTALISAVLFCSGVAAFCLMLLHLLIEVPISWLSSATRLRVSVPFAALRPLSVVIGLSLVLNLIIGLYIAELWPAAVVALLRH